MQAIAAINCETEKVRSEYSMLQAHNVDLGAWLQVKDLAPNARPPRHKVATSDHDSDGMRDILTPGIMAALEVRTQIMHFKEILCNL